MIKKLILVFTVIIPLTVSITFGQSIADIQSPKILPPSPDAAALGKYAQIPVDKSTGVPEISIPLYEIKTARFSLPISLSYHASGIKVDETAPWTGLGWSLNAGGAVSRTIMGVADDYAGAGFCNIAVPLAQSMFTNFHADSSYMVNVANNQADSQPDNFFYNFAGNSGAFVFNNLTTSDPVLIPYKPLQISFVQGTAGSFTIYDEQGNMYFFNDKELSTNPVSNGLNNQVTTWYLSTMVSADKSDTIQFQYQPDPGIFSDNSYSNMQNLGPGANNGNGDLWNLVTTINTSHCQQIHLSSIRFKGGKVDFISKTPRKDKGIVALDSVIISNYDYNQKKYNRLKSFTLITDYFKSGLSNPGLPYNNNNDSASYYRLRLSGLQENDQGNNAVKTHQFAYNNLMPPLHNFGQDVWGYFNGYYTNQTLLQTQQVFDYFADNPIVYTIAGNGLGANRSVSATNMQAGILTQITYPTKGYTTFTYEPNQYMAPAVTTYTPSANSVGVYHDTSTVNFTPILPNGQTAGPLSFHVQMTKNPQTSFVRIYQGNTIIWTDLGSTTTDITTDVPVTVTSGTTYQLMAVSYDNIDQSYSNGLPFSVLSTSYQVTGAPVPTNVGGLRVKTITNYDNNNAVISTERYKYGTTGNESGAGDFLTAASLMVYQSSHLYQFQPGFEPETSGELTFSNNSVYPLSSLSGSPVAYEQVTVYHGDTVNNIGKSVYNYTITGDSILQYSQPVYNVPYSPGMDALTQQWVYFTNTGGGGAPGGGILPVPRLWQNGEPIMEAHYANNGSGQYTPVQTKSTNYQLFFRAGGRGLHCQYALELAPGATRGFTFVNPNDFIFYDYPISAGSRVPVSTTTTNYAPGSGIPLTAETVGYYYDNLTHMQPTRIVSYDSQSNTWLKQVNYPQDMVNAHLDPTGIYAAMSAANIISPVVQFTQSKNGTQLEQSVTNYSYSTTGIINPQTVQLQTMANPAEVRLNYQKYDTNGNLLTVSKENGPPVSYIWGYNGEYPVAEATNANANDIFFESFEDGNGNSSSGVAKTGYYSHTGAYSKTLTGLDNGNYLLTYWQQSGTAWGLVSAPVTVSGGTYTISLSAQVDDIRFYPAGSQMVTYTYIPTVGVSSVTDAKNETTFYEYDQFERLLNIKDINGNIIKSFCYNYAGQTTGCDVNPLPAPPPATYGFTLTNSTGVSGFVANFSGGVGNLNFPTSGSTVYQIPAGSYTVTVNPINAPTNRKFLLGARAPVTAPGVTFTSVMVGPTNTETPLIIQNP